MAEDMAEFIEDIMSSMTIEVALVYLDMMALEDMVVYSTFGMEPELVALLVGVVVSSSEDEDEGEVVVEVVMVVVLVAEAPSYMVMVESPGMARTPCWAAMPKMARRIESVVGAISRFLVVF
jgi:hypothetical protein